MDTAAADIRRWARGQEAAARRVAREARPDAMTFAEALERVDDLRHAADALGAAGDPRHSDQDNLAFHLTWASVRRACGVG